MYVYLQRNHHSNGIMSFLTLCCFDATRGKYVYENLKICVLVDTLGFHLSAQTNSFFVLFTQLKIFTVSQYIATNIMYHKSSSTQTWRHLEQTHNYIHQRPNALSDCLILQNTESSATSKQEKCVPLYSNAAVK